MKGEVPEPDPPPLAEPVQLLPKTVDGVSEGEEEEATLVDILERRRKEGEGGG